MENKKLATHTFKVNEKDNGGEGLYITTQLFDNGDKTSNLYFTQTLKLNSYTNSASFELGTAILDPSRLRQLANELDSMISAHSNKR